MNKLTQILKNVDEWSTARPYATMAYSILIGVSAAFIVKTSYLLLMI